MENGDRIPNDVGIRSSRLPKVKKPASNGSCHQAKNLSLKADHAWQLDRPGRVVKPSANAVFARPIDQRRFRERFQHEYCLSYKGLPHGEKEF